MEVKGILSAIKTTMGGLSHQMKRLEVVSENIANAEKSPDKNGKVYQRKLLEPASNSKLKRRGDEFRLQLRKTNQHHIEPSAKDGAKKGKDLSGMKIVEEKGEKLVYNPSHPKADENGFVKMPNVNLVNEMMDLISASRTYEANVTVINAAKKMAKKSMEI
jgi:flagellar basal-body rod protein FlgC